MRTLVPVSCLVLLSAAALSAHPGHSAGEAGFAAGFLHPLSGLDHLLALLATGLLAWRLGGLALRMLPAAFLVGLGGGAVLALAAPALVVGAEGLIIASLIALMLALIATIALGRTPSLPIAASVLAVLATGHGLAHLADMPAHGDAIAYGLGVLFASALVLSLGMGLAMMSAALAKNCTQPTEG